MKRLAALIAGVLAALPVLTACSTSPDESQDPAVDTVYVDNGKRIEGGRRK